MRSATSNPILVGLVLLFALGHFLLLVGILMRIGATCWRQTVRARGLCLKALNLSFNLTNKRPGGSL